MNFNGIFSNIGNSIKDINWKNQLGTFKDISKDFWLENKNTIITEMLITGIPIAIKGFVILLKKYNTKQAKQYEEKLYREAAQYAKETEDQYQKAGKEILEEMERILQKNKSVLSEEEINEFRDIISRHRGWVYNKDTTTDKKVKPSDGDIIILQLKEYKRHYPNETLGDYRRAIEELNVVIVNQPKNYSAFYWRGYAKSIIGDNLGAIQDYNISIEYKPNSSILLTSRGISRFELKDYTGAIEDFDKAIECNDRYAAAYFNRGYCMSLTGNYLGAIQDFEHSVRIDSKYQDQNCYYETSQLKYQAIQDIDFYYEKLKVNPDDSFVYFKRGCSRMEIGQVQESIQDFNEAIKYNPNSAQYYTLRGCAKAELGYHHNAIADYTKAIELNPNYPRSYYCRGISKYSIGDTIGAINDYDKAKLLGF